MNVMNIRNGEPVYYRNYYVVTFCDILFTKKKKKTEPREVRIDIPKIVSVTKNEMKKLKDM